MATLQSVLLALVLGALVFNGVLIHRTSAQAVRWSYSQYGQVPIRFDANGNHAELFMRGHWVVFPVAPN